MAVCVWQGEDSSPWPKYFVNEFSAMAQSLAMLLTVGAVGSSVEEKA